MNVSDKGIALIKSFEAYMKKLPDGGCMAYQEKLGEKNGKPIFDIPTIGWGCTEGVRMGDIWTREQAEAAFRKEIAKHEAIVNRVVTTDITQGMFDALVSLNYNCGRLAKSTLLKKLNAGDVMAAAAEFSKFSYAGGVQLKGLVRRRAAEKALFLSDIEADNDEHCPQQADKRKPIGVIIKENKEVIAVSGTVVGGVTAKSATDATKEQPAPNVKKHLEKAQEARAQVEQAKDLGLWAKQSLSGDGAWIFIALIIGSSGLLVYNFVRGRS